MNDAKWIPFSTRMPGPSPHPRILVTNGIDARDAFGHHSHVWLVAMVHTHTVDEKRPGTTFVDAYAGEFQAFNERDQRLRCLTHWRPAIVEEWTWGADGLPTAIVPEPGANA